MIDERNVCLENLSADHVKIIMSDRNGSFFNRSEPMVQIRTGDRKAAEDGNE